ncbi:MAG: L-aspartate oxidase [Dehalococcoidia bacterium]|nr:L-aspartate oxidase [Dehalococcoidia bacterium]
MLEKESMTTDILIIGSGIAGMIAAIEARKGGARVTIATKGSLGKEASTAVARTFRTYHGDEIGGREVPGYDDEPGKHIEDWAMVHAIIDEAEKQIQNLIKMGVPMVYKSSHAIYEKMPVWRPEGSDNAHGGAIVLDILAPVVRQMGVEVVEGCQMVNLLKDEGRVAGASGLRRDGRWLSIYARAVILATGGAAGMSEVASAPREIAGNGYAMALKAGLPLKNVEFNQFYPVGLPTPTGQYVHCAPLTLMMEQAVLKNDKSEDIIKKHFGLSVQDAMAVSSIRFDWLPRGVALELEKGKVWLDLTRVPAAEWDKLPERNWKQIRRTQVDMKKTPLPVMPLSHAFRGGLLVSPRMQTPMQGLYAAGEVTAGWMAGERGLGNLPSCLAMGAIAARNAVADMEGVKSPRQAGVVDDGLEEAQGLAKAKGRTSPVEAGDEIRRVMYRHAGPVKSSTSLQEGLRELDRLEAGASEYLCSRAEELKDGLETKAMLLAGRAIMKAALMRTESRGGFYRRDFPHRNDKEWLRPVLVSYDRASGEVRAEPGGKLVLPKSL